MPPFNFRAITQQGLTKQGTVDAVSREAALQLLVEDGLMPLLCVRQEEPKDIMQMLSRVRPIKLEIIAQFSRQLATLINAGTGIVRALQVLEAQTVNPRFKMIIGEVRSDVHAGITFPDALTKHPIAFPYTYVAMIRAGETSGALDHTLQKLAEQLEAELKIKRAVRSATVYPKVIAVVAGIICAGLLLFIVPRFAKIYVETAQSVQINNKPIDASLPKLTRIVVSISNVLFPGGPKNLSWIFQFFLRLVVLGISIYAIRLGFRYALTKETVRRQWDHMKLNFPFKIGELVREVATARFARVFSTMIEAGIQPVEALASVADVSGNILIREAILSARQHMIAGQNIAGPLERSKVFPPMLTQMIEIGEESGDLVPMLEKVAEFYEAEVDAKIKALTSIIEPLMIIGIGSVVGFLIIVNYLPMFHLYDLISPG